VGVELVRTELLVKHHPYIGVCVPVAVIVEGAGLLENPVKLGNAGAHPMDVMLNRAEPVVKRALLFGVTPKDFVVPVGVEWRVDVDEVYALVGEVAQLLQVIPTVDELALDQ
jgi:hypothetical protein